MVWIILAILVAFGTCSIVLSARQKRAEQAERVDPTPAWQREGAVDLTAPIAPAAPTDESAGPQAPIGARFRPAGEGNDVGGAVIMREVTEGLDRVPPLPQALYKILRELDSAGSSAKSVSTIVATEPVLTATLLRVVNSAAMGLRREILTVAEAVAYLGFSTVKAIVLRIKLAQLMPSRGTGRGYNNENLWVHSMAVSQLAEYLARRVGGVDPALAATLGLLHDIGKLAINSQFPRQVAKVFEPDPNFPGESFLGRERRLFGADHAHLGAYLAARWNLPEDLATGIRLHHITDPNLLADLRPELARAIAVVQVANQLAKYCQVYCDDMEIDILPPEMLAGMGLPADLDQVLDARAREVVERSLEMARDPAGQKVARKPLAKAG